MKNMKKMHSNAKGFTLIELMIVVAIIGILAAIALPAYQDYVQRTKVSGAALAMSAYKTGVALCYAANGEFDDCDGNGTVSAENADVPRDTSDTNRINYVAVAQTRDGVIQTITTGLSSDADPVPLELQWIPVPPPVGNGPISWNLTRSGCKVEPGDEAIENRGIDCSGSVPTNDSSPTAGDFPTATADEPADGS